MARSTSSPPAAGAAAGILLLLALLALSPGAAAQAPSRPDSGVVDFAVVCPMSFVMVPYNGQGLISCQVQDLTDDSLAPPTAGSGPLFPLQSHTVTFKVVATSPPNATGWQVNPTQNPVVLRGRETFPVDFIFQSTPTVGSQQYTAVIEATYGVPNSAQKVNKTIALTAQVARYDFAIVETTNTNQRAGQFDLVKYQIHVRNEGVYPDVYRFEVKAPPDFHVAPPSTLYLGPKKEGNVTVTILTPHDRLYELGRSVLFDFKTISTTGVSSYGTIGILNVSGPYVPTYWIPLGLVGLVAAVIVTRRGRERAEIRRLEAGRPRRVEPTPRQAALLAELRRRDPERYREQRQRLAAAYAERAVAYRDTRKVQLAKDAEERAVAKREYAEARRRRKEEARAAKAQAALDKKAAKRQRKLDKRQAAVDRRARQKKEKEIMATRKRLDKAKAAQARVDAKQAQRDAKAQAKADREAAKQAKAAARAAKKGGAPPP